MKLLICEFSVPDDIVTPPLQRSLLMGRRYPPNIMAIWIGRYLGDGFRNVYLRHAATIGWAPIGTIPTVSPGRLAKIVQSQSFFIGELFVQAVTHTVEQLGFQTPPAFAPFMRQIWPFQREFAWPPQQAAFDFHAYAISSSFERFASRLRFAPGASRV
jgi:hypothetical protein